MTKGWELPHGDLILCINKQDCIQSMVMMKGKNKNKNLCFDCSLLGNTERY